VFHLTGVGYSLGTTYTQQQEFEKMQGKVVSAFLAASGYNIHFPRALVFTPKEHGGLGFVHLHLLQGQQSIKLLLLHTVHRTAIGKQIYIDLAWIQQEAGTTGAILEETQTKLDYVQDGWLMGVRRFICSVEGKIKIIDIK
jgi:hypothetical protein